jgi:hypothetical protein
VTLYDVMVVPRPGFRGLTGLVYDADELPKHGEAIAVYPAYDGRRAGDHEIVVVTAIHDDHEPPKITARPASYVVDDSVALAH